MCLPSVLPRLFLACLALGPGLQLPAHAQAAPAAGCERARAEVRAECRAFIRTHRWDEGKGDYVPRMPGRAASQPPEGVMGRADVRAARDAFLQTHRWNDTQGVWEPVSGAPRDLSARSRAEVRQENQAFMRTHRWDDASETYIEVRPAKPK